MTTLTLTAWREHERRIAERQPREGLPLLDRLAPEFVERLTPAEALALKYEPAAYLRPPQMVDDADPSWLTWVFMTGRGWGKSLACAAWMAGRILARDAGTYALIAPTIEDGWRLQWATLRALLPPHVRYVERNQRQQVYFPDHGVLLMIHPARVVEFRGSNLRGAWCEEPIIWGRGDVLWRNLERSLRVAAPGRTPPRTVVATTPPVELTWVLDVCAEPTTRVVRGRMRDNPTLPEARVEHEYRAHTADARRELDGEVVIGVEGALFSVEDLERHRVDEAPELDAVVIAVDPAQSARKDADTVGVVALGIARGHLYVLESVSEHMTPEGWSSRALAMADEHAAGRYVVETTGAGEAPRALLTQAMRLDPGAPQLPIVGAKARTSKSDRAAPLAGASSRGRFHLVGRGHAALERELTTWHPGAGWSPGALDALVHGAAVLTSNWRALQ